MKKALKISLLVVVVLLMAVGIVITLKLHFDGRNFEKGNLYIIYSNEVGLPSKIVSYDQNSLKVKGTKYYNFSGITPGNKQVIVDEDKVFLAPFGDFKNKNYKKILGINSKGNIQDVYNLDGDISPSKFIVTNKYFYTYSNLNYEFFIKRIDRNTKEIKTIKAEDGLIGISGLTYCNNDIYGIAMDIDSSNSKIYKYDFDTLKEYEVFEIGNDENALDQLVCNDSELYYVYNDKVLKYDINNEIDEEVINLLSDDAIDIVIKEDMLYIVEYDMENVKNESIIEIFNLDTNNKLSDIKIQGNVIQSEVDSNNNLWVLFFNDEGDFLVNYDYKTGKELSKISLKDQLFLSASGFAIK